MQKPNSKFEQTLTKVFQTIEDNTYAMVTVKNGQSMDITQYDLAYNNYQFDIWMVRINPEQINNKDQPFTLEYDHKAAKVISFSPKYLTFHQYQHLPTRNHQFGLLPVEQQAQLLKPINEFMHNSIHAQVKLLNRNPNMQP